MIFRFSDYVLDIDVDRTREFYAREDIETTSEKCTCQGCQNYDKAILAASDTVVDFLRSLGIDPRKPAEVFDIMGGQLDENGQVLYNGFYHICGTRIEGEDAWVHTSENSMHLDMDRMYTVDDSFKVSFEEQVLLLHKEFPAPVLQMEIDARLPWVLSEPYHT